MRLDHVGLNVADLDGDDRAGTARRWSSTVEFEFALDHVDFRGVMLRSPDGLPRSSCCTGPATSPGSRPPTRSRPR